VDEVISSKPTPRAVAEAAGAMAGASTG